ncbi:MAG: YeeE/YedE thiosulfate transporter family protein [Nitrososphaeria archaeon]
MFLGLIIGGFFGQKYVDWKVPFIYSRTNFIEEKIGSNKSGVREKGFNLSIILLIIEIFFISIALSYYALIPNGGLYATILFFGLAVGVTIQRSRFCFATAFRDLLHGPEFKRSIRINKGLILGLLVGVTGIFVLKYRGYIEVSNFVAPVSFLNILGGAIFAFGSVLSGGCASGILWRVGEGHLNALITIFTAVLSFPILRSLILISGTGFFIPSLGWATGIALSYVIILVYLAFILYLQGKYD